MADIEATLLKQLPRQQKLVVMHKAGASKSPPLPPRVERLLTIIAEVERKALALAGEQKP